MWPKSSGKGLRRRRRTRIVVLYASKDWRLMELVVSQLRALGPRFSVWVYQDSEAGAEWELDLFRRIDEAHVVLLLITSDFLNSPFIMKREVPCVLARRRRGEVHLVPIIGKPCPWRAHRWLARLQVRPKNGTPLLKPARKCDQEERMAAIAMEIRGVVEGRRALV